MIESMLLALIETWNLYSPGGVRAFAGGARRLHHIRASAFTPWSCYSRSVSPR
jgi:hypothetical protein